MLIVLLGTIAFSASKMLYQGKLLGEIQVGVVLPPNDPLAKQVVTMLGSLDSVESLCQFRYVELEQGQELLRRGEIYALMNVPEGFVESIMNGSNIPIQIIFPKNAGMESVIFKQLTDSGSRTLGVAQAAIYAADEFCIINQMSDSIPQVEADLNKIFMDYSISRSVYFRDMKVSATGDISIADYYGISGILLFMLLCGIPAAQFLKPPSPVLARKLTSIGIGPVQTVGARVLSVFLLLALVSALIVTGLVMGNLVQLSLAFVCAWLLVCLSCATLIVCCYQLAGGLTAGVMLLFLSSVTMVFLSGGFVPSVFLPKVLTGIGSLLPTTLILDVMKGMLTEPDVSAMFRLVVMELLLFVVASAVRRQHE